MVYAGIERYRLSEDQRLEANQVQPEVLDRVSAATSETHSPGFNKHVFRARSKRNRAIYIAFVI